MKPLVASFAAIALFASPAAAAVLLPGAAGEIVVADEGSIRSVAVPSMEERWNRPGLRFPLFGVTAEDGGIVAIVAPVDERVAIVRDGEVALFDVPGAPVAAELDGEALFLATRGGMLIRIEGESVRSVPVAAGSPLLAVDGRAAIVYDQISGTIERFDPATLARIESGRTEAFASRIAIESGTVYLVVPRSGRLVTILLDDLSAGTGTTAGAAPVDLAIEAPANATRGAVLVLADPAAKRIRRIEGKQSLAQAIGRGFVRGLLGLGLFSPSSASMPTGADRVFRRDGRTWAFDSTTGTLYAIRGADAEPVATGLRWNAFVIRGEWLYAMRDGRLVSESIGGR